MMNPWRSAVVLMVAWALAGPLLAGDPPEPGRLEVIVRGIQGPADVVCIPIIPPNRSGGAIWSGKTDQTPSLAPGPYDLIVYEENRATVRSLVEIRAGQTATVRMNLPNAPDACGEKIVVEYDQPKRGYGDLYKNLLSSMKRPPFCEQFGPSQPPVEMYRFLWMRSFHHPILIEVSFSIQGAAKVRYIETSGMGGYSNEVGKVVADETIDGAAVLAKEHGVQYVDGKLQYIRGKAAQEGFWTLASEVEDGSIVADGSTWIIEGRRDGNCKVVIRTNIHDPQFKAFAEQLIRLSGKRFYHDEYY